MSGRARAALYQTTVYTELTHKTSTLRNRGWATKSGSSIDTSQQRVPESYLLFGYKASRWQGAASRNLCAACTIQNVTRNPTSQSYTTRDAPLATNDLD